MDGWRADDKFRIANSPWHFVMCDAFEMMKCAIFNLTLVERDAFGCYWTVLLHPLVDTTRSCPSLPHFQSPRKCMSLWWDDHFVCPSVAAAAIQSFIHSVTHLISSLFPLIYLVNVLEIRDWNRRKVINGDRSQINSMYSTLIHPLRCSLSATICLPSTCSRWFIDFPSVSVSIEQVPLLWTWDVNRMHAGLNK